MSNIYTKINNKHEDISTCNMYMNKIINEYANIYKQLQKSTYKIKKTKTNGGIKKTKTTKTTKTTKKTKKNKKNKKTKGGISKNLLLFILQMYCIFGYVLSIRPIKDETMIKRINNMYQVKEILDNTYGWCVANAALLLDSIDISTHREMAIHSIKTGEGVNEDQLNKILEKNLQTTWTWDYVLDVDEELLNQEDVYVVKDYVDLKKIEKGTFPNVMVTNEKTFIEIYIEILKQKLHNIRKKHTNNKGIITAFRFREDVNGGHMTGLWLTSNDELLLVNVQDFVEEENKIILYSDDITNNNSLFKNNNIEIKSLTEYFKENLNLEYILYSQIVSNIHSEINNDFSKQNFDIIYSIKSIENAIQENES